MQRQSASSQKFSRNHLRPNWILGGVALALLLHGGVLLAASRLLVIVKDESGKLLAGASVLLRREAGVSLEVVTDSRGEAVFDHLTVGNCRVTVFREGKQPSMEQLLLLKENEDQELEIVLVAKIELKQSVEVSGSAEAVAEQGASPPAQLERNQIQALPNRPRALEEVLPMLPGVVRTPDDQIRISGSAEHSSALSVNTADVTDPATGQFGMSVPVDIIEAVNVFKTPYLAQYGRFSAGLVSVETRRGGDKWKFEFNDPVPEFRIRGGTIMGVRGFTPRINFNGPLLAHRLYLSEGMEYRINKRPVRTLGFPVNETKEEAKNIFTQLDWVVSPNHLFMGTFHWAPWRAQYVNLDYFNPQSATPNFKAEDYTVTLLDRLQSAGRQWETLLAVKRYQAKVWAQGMDEMILTPLGNRGNYFSQQERKASRVEWGESVALRPWEWHGSHQWRLGLSVTYTSNRGEFLARPVNIMDKDDRLYQRIEFAGGKPFDSSDAEVDLYGQDQWKVHPRAALNLGMRLEKQRITHALRMAPRVGLVWTPVPNQATVVRTGFGLFFNHAPLSVYAFPGYPEQMVTTYNPDGTILAGPDRWMNVTTSLPGQHFPVYRQGSTPGNFAAYSATWNVELEHPLTSYLRLRANFLESHTRGLILVEPGTVSGQPALMLDGKGNSHYRQFELTSRFTWKEKQEFLVSYVRSQSLGDYNDFNRYLGNYPYPLVRPNYFTRTPGDTPNRFLSWGVVNLPLKFTFAPQVEVRTGFPYSVLDEHQEYVGIPNSDLTRFPLFFSLDTRLTRVFKIFFKPKYSVRCGLRVINLTNHFNPLGIHANIDDPRFGTFFGYVRRTFVVDLDVLR
jgi:hypothetical protein